MSSRPADLDGPFERLVDLLNAVLRAAALEHDAEDPERRAAVQSLRRQANSIWEQDAAALHDQAADAAFRLGGAYESARGTLAAAVVWVLDVRRWNMPAERAQVAGEGGSGRCFVTQPPEYLREAVLVPGQP